MAPARPNSARSKAPRRRSAAKPRFKAVKTGPIIGPEPDWLHDVPLDNLVNAITALAGEVYILRERQRAMERELSRRNVLPPRAVEDHAPSPAERQADQDDLRAFVTRLWDEIARGRAPWAAIDPGVTKYFKQPK
jgi:hypothetical protein